MHKELEKRVLAHLKGRNLSQIVGQGGRHRWIEESNGKGSIYRAYDFPASSPGVLLHDPADPLPLEDASQDLMLTLDLFERLRMDQLYMVAAESRRTLRQGGLWLLSGLSFGEDLLRIYVGGALRKLSKRRALELTHYISPEDWRTLENKKWNEGLLTQQFLALERL